MNRPRRTAAALAVASTILLLVLPAEVAACPVCYGEAEGNVIDGAKLSVVFLGALVYAVIGGGIGLVLLVRRRARTTTELRADPRRGLELIRESDA